MASRRTRSIYLPAGPTATELRFALQTRKLASTLKVMPWMLLDTPPSDLPSGNGDRATTTSSATIATITDNSTAFAERQEPGPHQNEAAEHSPPLPGHDRIRTAWALAGDLADAVCMTGVVEVLVEKLPKPTLIYASGAATIDALLARGDGAFDVRVAWEGLRAAHLLDRAVLTRLPALGTWAAQTCPWADSTLTKLLAHSNVGSEVPVELFTGTTYHRLECPPPHSDKPDPVLAKVLFSTADLSQALAAAIFNAAERSMDRILIIAPPRVTDDPFFHQAIDQAKTKGTIATQVAVPTVVDPGPLAYLLPALGSIERLVETGRRTARAWVRSDAASGLGRVTAADR